MKNRLVLIFMMFLSTSLMAEELARKSPSVRVKGVVVDEKGEALAGASVRVKGTVIGAGTNANGEFSFQLTSKKKCVLQVSFTGYTSRELEIMPGADRLYRFALSPSDNTLNEVVITGTRTMKSLKDVPVLTRLISRENIAQINPLDLQNLLQYEMPGLQFGLAHGSGLPALKFQGSTGGYVLFLVDGERISGEGASNNIDYCLIDIDYVERIEVVKGPMSTLYGSQAMGGVVNIITKDVNRPFTGSLSTRYGTNGENKHALSLGTKHGGFSALTSLSYRTRKPYALNDRRGQVQYTHYNDGRGRNSVVTDTSKMGVISVKGFEIWQVNQKLSYAFNERLHVSLDGMYYNNHVLDYIPEKTRDVFSTYKINPGARYTIHEHHELNFSYVFENYEKKITYKTLPSKKILGDQTHTARLNYTGYLHEKHTLTAGVEVNTQTLQHFWFDNGSGKTYGAQTYVLYLQDDYKVSDSFTVLAGVRSDCHSKYGFHASPKISLMYRHDMLSLRGGYGMGFRIPSLKELYSEYDMGGQGFFMIYGNENLKPEISHQGTLSAEVTKGIFNGSVSGYYTRFFNEIGLGLSPDRKNQQYYNANHATRTGMDAMAQFSFKNGLTLRGAYAYINSHSKIDGYNMASDRPHSVTFTANYSREIGQVTLSAALNGRWMSPVETWYKNQAGGYVQNRYDGRTFCSLNLSGHFPRGIRFTAGLDNLFNFKDKNVTADQSVTPQRGIGFIGTLSVNLANVFKL